MIDNQVETCTVQIRIDDSVANKHFVLFEIPGDDDDDDIPKPIVRVNVPKFDENSKKILANENDNEETKNEKDLQCKRLWGYYIIEN
jgi:hypothetical protein